MPQVFKIGSYWVYFWANENDPLEPIHVHVSQGAPSSNATKIWITRAGKCYLCHNNSNIPPRVLRNIMAIIPRTASPERFSAVLDSVSRGMVCFPGEWVRKPSSPQALLALSERQREVLKLLAAGESNKEIGRNLNISAATVKAHLEALFRRLDVKNRTQAAMYYTRATA